MTQDMIKSRNKYSISAYTPLEVALFCWQQSIDSDAFFFLSFFNRPSADQPSILETGEIVFKPIRFEATNKKGLNE